MHLRIPELISPELARALVQALMQARFTSGGRTAGTSVASLKHNLELADPSQLPPALLAELMKSVRTNSQLSRWAQPKQSVPLLFNRFDAGMYYRDHVDNPLAVIDRTFHRVDISMTLFLSDPADYDGGELVIASDGDARELKLPAGSAVLYTTGVVHRVNEVRRGTRLAAVTWLESLIRGHAERELIYDLTQAQELLAAGDLEATREKVAKCIVNLTRMWTD